MSFTLTSSDWKTDVLINVIYARSLAAIVHGFTGLIAVKVAVRAPTSSVCGNLETKYFGNASTITPKLSRCFLAQTR